MQAKVVLKGSGPRSVRTHGRTFYRDRPVDLEVEEAVLLPPDLFLTTVYPPMEEARIEARLELPGPPRRSSDDPLDRLLES